MRSNESGNEIGCDALEIDVKLADGKIGRQELLMNATKRAQEVADEGPHAFNGVDMNFADAVAIIVTCPLSAGMTDRVVRTVQVVVALPFIGIDLGVLLGEVFDMSLQGCRIGVFDHA